MNLNGEFAEIIEAYDDLDRVDLSLEFDSSMSWEEEDSAAEFFRDVFSINNIWIKPDEMSIDSKGNFNIPGEIYQIIEAYEELDRLDLNVELDLSMMWDENDSLAYFLNDILSINNSWVELENIAISNKHLIIEKFVENGI